MKGTDSCDGFSMVYRKPSNAVSPCADATFLAAARVARVFARPIRESWERAGIVTEIVFNKSRLRRIAPQNPRNPRYLFATF